MTNLARIDKNLENSEGPPLTSDDQALFLSHAAYGLFSLNENLGLWIQPSRLVGFHFGYDAFADEDDARTTDIENAVSATFTGTTMAQMVANLTNRGDNASRPLRFDLRGDIELRASIGGSGGGKISGVISGFEVLGPDGTWHPHAAIIDPTKRERLVLTGANYNTRQTNGVFEATEDYAADAATINADGSYEGGVYLQSYSAGRWRDKTTQFDTTVTTGYTRTADDGTTTHHPGSSQFGGRLYGPVGDDLSGLETAGHWLLSSKTGCAPPHSISACPADRLRTGLVYGSFGATQ